MTGKIFRSALGASLTVLLAALLLCPDWVTVIVVWGIAAAAA